MRNITQVGTICAIMNFLYAVNFYHRIQRTFETICVPDCLIRPLPMIASVRIWESNSSLLASTHHLVSKQKTIIKRHQQRQEFLLIEYAFKKTLLQTCHTQLLLTARSVRRTLIHWLESMHEIILLWLFSLTLGKPKVRGNSELVLQWDLNWLLSGSNFNRVVQV